MPERTLAVIDGNSLLHRAFHALPVTMTAPDGRPTNAAYGFISMLLKLTESFDPDTLIVAFDKGRPAFRTEVLERYKVHRPPTPDELRPQFGIAKELLGAMNVPVVECDGWEGDDLLGTFAKRGEAEGLRVLLFTGDKDAYQLVTEQVSVVSTKKGITEIVVYDPDAVEARLGVRPDQVPTTSASRGTRPTTSPGCRGSVRRPPPSSYRSTGRSTRCWTTPRRSPGKVGENLRAHTDDARASREVATIRTDAPVECDIELALWGAIDSDAVVRVFTAYRMVSLVERVLALGRAHGRKLAARPGEMRPQTSRPTQSARPRRVADALRE